MKFPSFAIPAAASLILAALALPGCKGGSEAGPSGGGGAKEISFLTMQLSPTFDEYFKGIAAQFEAAHPGVKVKWLDYPFQNYETKVMTALMGPNPPDVINFGSESVPTFAESGHLLDLETVLPPEVFQEYLPNMIEEGCKSQGRIHALPWYLATFLTMYNTEIFKEAGIELTGPPNYIDDLPEYCRIIREKTDKFAYFPIYTEGGQLRYYLLEAGVPLTNRERTRAAFNTPEGVEVLRFWADLYKKGLAPSEAVTATHRRPIELYKTGRLAIFSSGPQFLRNIKSDSPEVYAATRIGPRMTWRNKPASSIVPLHVMAVAKKTRQPQLAAELAAFITNSQNQLKFSQITTIFPSALTALEDPYFTEADDTVEGLARKLSAEQLKTATLMFTPKDARRLLQVMDETMEAVCLGRKTPEQGLADAEKVWNEGLAK